MKRAASLISGFLTALFAFSAPLSAEEVDVELVLAVDVSGSMTETELAIQRRGYVEAFRSDEVHKAIASGLLGKVAVLYVEWARADLKKIIVPWTIIDGPQASNAFAEQLEAQPVANMRNTSITGAIAFGAEQILRNDMSGMRRVIDISGDGPNNQGGLVTEARDAAVAEGIVINGLPLMTGGGFGDRSFDIGTLDAYYRACVIGGPGAFVIPVNDWANFAEAVRRKLVLELATRDAFKPVPVQFLLPETPSVDCQIGEKLRRLYSDP